MEEGMLENIVKKTFMLALGGLMLSPNGASALSLGAQYSRTYSWEYENDYCPIGTLFYDAKDSEKPDDLSDSYIILRKDSEGNCIKEYSINKVFDGFFWVYNVRGIVSEANGVIQHTKAPYPILGDGENGITFEDSIIRTTKGTPGQICINVNTTESVVEKGIPFDLAVFKPSGETDNFYNQSNCFSLPDYDVGSYPITVTVTFPSTGKVSSITYTYQVDLPEVEVTSTVRKN